MYKDDDEFILRPKRARRLPKERDPRPRVITKRATIGTRTFNSRAIAKVTYTRHSNQKGRSSAAHVRYLRRESAQSHELGIDREFGTCSARSFMKPLAGEKRVFRVILSPEEFFTIDTKLYVHEFMRELLGRAGVWESGQNAFWRAFVHTNTEHPHIHCLIHGIANDGRDLYFQPHVIKEATSLATRTQERMTSWFPVSLEILQERRQAREYGPMPWVGGTNLDELLQAHSGRSSWKDLLDSVPFYRRNALHRRMVVLENHDLLRQKESGAVVVAPDLAEQLETLRRGLGLVREKAKLRCLVSPRFEFAHARSPVAFGLLTPVIEIGSKKSRYTVLETTKDTAIAIRVLDDEVDLINTLARERALVRLKNGKAKAFRGDARRLIRVALHSVGPVAQQVLAKYQVSDEIEKAQPQVSSKGFGY